MELVTNNEIRVDTSRFPTETNDTIVTDATDGPMGIASYMRRTRKAGGSVSGRGFSLTGGNVSESTLALDAGAMVTPGETITLKLFVRMASVSIDWRFFYRFGAAGSTAWLGANNTSAYQNGQPGSWLAMSAEFVVPEGADRFSAIAGMNPVTAPAGETYDATGMMFVRGKYSGPYRDGGFPLWRWEGTEGQSRSIGYNPIASLSAR